MTDSEPENRAKVAHVVNNAKGQGGVSNVAYHLMELLPSDRYERHLYSLDANKGNQEEGSRRYEALGVKVSFASTNNRKYHPIGDLAKWLLANEIEILHTHSYRPNIIGRLAGILYGNIKIVGHYHNYYDDKWEKENSLIFDQLLAPHSDRLIAVSKAVQDHIATKTGIPLEKIDVIRNGVDLHRFDTNHGGAADLRKELGLPDNYHLVGVIGRISAQKAQDDFIKAAQKIKTAIPNTAFLIVGESKNEALASRLTDLAISLGIQKDVIFTGYMSEIHKVFSMLDIVVMSSLWEGLPLILVEAMACGKPIVATDISPIVEVVIPGETARLVPTASPSSLAAEVIDLLQHPDEAKEMGKRGRERAKDFSWEPSGIQVDQMYQCLLETTVSN